MSLPPPPAPAPATAGPAAPHVADGFAWWAPFVAFLGTLVVSFVAFGVLTAATGGEADDPGITLGATFVQDLALVGSMIVLARLTGVRVTPATFGLRRPEGSWRAFLMACLVFVVFFAFLAAWSNLDPGAEDDLASDLGADESTVALIATALLTTIVAPVVEELFFRGFLFGALRRAMGWIWAAVLAGIIFGGVHLGTPAIFLVPLAVFGALLCVLYQRTGSLIPGMGVHALNNSLALGVGLDWTAGQTVTGMLVAPALVMTLATAVARR